MDVGIMKVPMGYFLMAVLICTVVFVEAIPFSKAQETSVNGIICQDTTWSKANSPYTLTGNIVVSNGSTLTIEAGVVVNLNNYDLEIRGGMLSQGNTTEPIHINGNSIFTGKGKLLLAASSSTGCIIENVVISSAEVSIGATLFVSHGGVPPTINNCSLINVRVFISSGSPIISNNTILGYIYDESGSRWGAEGANPIISGNTISPPPIDPKALYSVGSGILVGFSNGTILNNTITGALCGIQVGGSQRLAEIDTGDGMHNVVFFTFPVISNNTVIGCTTGIKTCSNEATIAGNTISGCPIGIRIETGSDNKQAGRPRIEHNLIVGNDEGILASSGFPIIVNNTIANNIDGVRVFKERSQDYVGDLHLKFNNIYANKRYNLWLEVQNDVNVAHNWWGTADPHLINQTIYDFDDDHIIGKANFAPFLTEPEPQAMPDFNTPIPASMIAQMPTLEHTPSITPSASPSSQQNYTPAASTTTKPAMMAPLSTELIVVVLAIVILTVAIVVFFVSKKTRESR